MHLVGNKSSMHWCNPPKNGLWVNLLFFMMCIYKHYVPPMLLVFAMKCFTNMPCLLPHNRYCCLLSSPMYLPHLLICTCLISSPVACPPSSVLCWCLLRFVTDVFSCLPHFFFWLAAELTTFFPSGFQSLQGDSRTANHWHSWEIVWLLALWKQ